MNRTMNIRNVDDQTYIRFRLLCLGNRLNMAGMLKKMADYWYENEKTLMGKGEQRKMKRFIKNLTLGGKT